MKAQSPEPQQSRVRSRRPSSNSTGRAIAKAPPGRRRSVRPARGRSSAASGSPESSGENVVLGDADFLEGVFAGGKLPSGSNRAARRRRITPGATHFITKKTNDDLFWLVPSPEVNQILLYTLLLKAEKYGILLHEFCFLSDHFHLIYTDPLAQSPAFMREFLCESAKALKQHLGTDRRIWDGERYGSTEILDRDAYDRKAAYVRLNPLAAGLTKPEEWPGLTSAKYEAGMPLVARRPDVYFDPDRNPDEIRATLVPPPEKITPSLEMPSPEVVDIAREPEEALKCARRRCRKSLRRVRESLEWIAEAVRSTTRRVLAELRRGGESLRGAAAVLRERRSRRGSRPFGTLNPRFASRDPAMIEAAVEGFRSFDAEHRAAASKIREGRRRVEFPYGTYGYRALWRVPVRGLALP